MDRQIIYVGAIPQDVDQLKQNKNTMIGLGYALQAILGTGTVVDGLACNPTGPASMNVQVGPGSIYSQEDVDATAYGSLNADTTDQIVKQGIILSTQTFSCPAPSTSGFSVVYLVEATYDDVDDGSTVLPYYNSLNPSQAYNGPNNTGTSQNTVRQGVCNVQVKTGVAATTGTQTTPAPDAGYTGLYAVTVAYGQTTITSGNIVQLSTAPFISPKLPNLIPTIQAGAFNYAADSSGTANTITIALNPAVASLTAGMSIKVKVANTNTGATVINTNGLGNVGAILPSGSALAPGALVANGIYLFVYDGSHWQLEGNLSPNALVGSTRNLTIKYATTTTLTVAADEVLTETALGGFGLTAASLSVTFNGGTTGANGMDTGSLPTSGVVYLYAITGPAASAAVLGTTSGSGASIYPGSYLPTGYNASALIGAYLTNSSADFYQFVQSDRKLFYGSTFTILNSVTGVTSFTSQSLSSAIPPCAKYARVSMQSNSSGSAFLQCAADSSGTGTITGLSTSGTVANLLLSVAAQDVLITTPQTVYWNSGGTAVAVDLYCTGYTI